MHLEKFIFGNMLLGWITKFEFKENCCMERLIFFNVKLKSSSYGAEGRYLRRVDDSLEGGVYFLMCKRRSSCHQSANGLHMY